MIDDGAICKAKVSALVLQSSVDYYLTSDGDSLVSLSYANPEGGANGNFLWLKLELHSFFSYIKNRSSSVTENLIHRDTAFKKLFISSKKISVLEL